MNKLILSLVAILLAVNVQAATPAKLYSCPTVAEVQQAFTQHRFLAKDLTRGSFNYFTIDTGSNVIPYANGQFEYAAIYGIVAFTKVGALLQLARFHFHGLPMYFVYSKYANGGLACMYKAQDGSKASQNIYVFTKKAGSLHFSRDMLNAVR